MGCRPAKLISEENEFDSSLVSSIIEDDEEDDVILSN
jgi:hypothetical protein